LKKLLAILRLLLGILLVAGLLSALFAASMPSSTAGAQTARAALTLPGDELSLIAHQWTHAITIDAPPEDVWPWIAQLGDRAEVFIPTRSSRTVSAATGARDTTWFISMRTSIQVANPQPGDEIIQGQLKIRSGTGTIPPGRFGRSSLYWVWSWSLKPIGENQTRMYIRTDRYPRGK
jgi:hypothetical protein